MYPTKPGQSRCTPVEDNGENRADAGSKSRGPANRPRAGPASAESTSCPRCGAACSGSARWHRISPGPCSSASTWSPCACCQLADGAVPGHLDQLDGDLRVPAVAPAAHHPDLGRRDAGHRRHHLRAGPQGPARRRLPGRSPADRADVPGHGVARPTAAGRHPGTADGHGTGAADFPGEPAAPGAAAPVPAGRIARAGHPDHRGPRPRRTDRAGRHRSGGGRGRPGSDRRTGPAAPADQPAAPAGLGRDPGLPARDPGTGRFAGPGRPGTLGQHPAPLAAGGGRRGDHARRQRPARRRAGRATGERRRPHRAGRPDRGRRPSRGRERGPGRDRLGLRDSAH